MNGTAGIPWFKELDYPMIRSLFADGEEFPETFDEWLDQAEQKERSYRQRGWEVFRVGIEAEKFSIWCKRENLPLNAAARRRFAAVMAGRMSRSS